MINEAKKKLAEECQKNEYLIPFEEYLTGICINEQIASRILKKEKTLKGAYENVREVARKGAKNGVGYVSDESAYKIIRDYYGIEDNMLTSDNVIDILDLL